MESDRNWEQNALISELIQGLEVARKLKEDLSSASSVDARDSHSLLQRILSSYDKALLFLRWNESVSMQQPTKTSSPQSPLSIDKTPLREDAEEDHQELKHNSKKRKMMPKWTEHIRVKIENGVEGPLEDGYSWRKYGQKDILSAKYPRSYYRCTFRKTKGCFATKQVQRSEEDHTIFDITYRGSHTCKRNDAVLPPKSPDYTQDGSLTVKTDNITAPSASFGCMAQDNYHDLFPSLVLENDPFFSTPSQTSSLSANTPESNYFVSPTFLEHEFDGVCNKPCPDSELARLVSADTSITSSPIFDFNFSLDAVGIDYPNFPFNI
ncbi:hypothetical protein AAZX31_01G210400 [Glycine max]